MDICPAVERSLLGSDLLYMHADTIWGVCVRGCSAPSAGETRTRVVCSLARTHHGSGAASVSIVQACTEPLGMEREGVRFAAIVNSGFISA